MKFFLAALLLVAAVSAHKAELKTKNTCANPLVTVTDVNDEKSGAVTLDSVLLLDFDTREDTSSHDPFEHVSEIAVYKYVFVGYVKIPNALLNFVCKKAEGLYPGKVKCLGAGDHGYKISVSCFMKDLTGHCYPAAGKTHLRFPIKPTLQFLNQHMNGIFAGWVKANIVTRSPVLGDKEDFCVEAEVKVDL